MRSTTPAVSQQPPPAQHTSAKPTHSFPIVDLALIVAAQYAVIFVIYRALFHQASADADSSLGVFQRASFHVIVCCCAWFALQFVRGPLQHSTIIVHVQHWMLTVAVLIIPFASDDIRSFLPPEYRERGAVVLPTLLLAFTVLAWLLSGRGRIAACVCYQTLHVLLDAGVIHAEHDPYTFWLTNSMFAACALSLDLVSGLFCRKLPHGSTTIKAKLHAAFNDHAYWLGLVGFGNAWLMHMFCMPEILILRDNVSHTDVVPNPLGYWQRDWPCRGSLYILSLYACSHGLWLLLGIAKRRKLWILLASVGLIAVVHLLMLDSWPDYPLSPLATMAAHIRLLTHK